MFDQIRTITESRLTRVPGRLEGSVNNRVLAVLQELFTE